MDLEKENINYLSLAQEILLFRGFTEWRKSPDKSLRKILKDACRYEMNLYQKFDSKQLLEACISSTISNLLRQNFVTSYDNLRHNIDDKMPTELKKLRDNLSTSKTNINTTKMFDVIRQAFAHNDIKSEHPNCTLNNDFKIEIDFKGNHFVFDFVELHSLLLQFIGLKNNSNFFTFGLKIDQITRAATSKKLSPDNIGRFVTQYQDGKEDEIILLDKYQKEALYNLFYNKGVNVEEHIQLLTDNKFCTLSQCFPIIGHPSQIIKNNNLAIRQLIWLNKKFSSRHDFLAFCFAAEGEMTLVDSDELWNPQNRQDYALFIHENSFIFEMLILNNIMFNIFSISNINNLKPYFNNLKLDVDINRIRNSYMHGRYYYNHDNAIEFYDGRTNDNLTHISSLTIDNLLDICSNFIEDNLNRLEAIPEFNTLLNPN